MPIDNQAKINKRTRSFQTGVVEKPDENLYKFEDFKSMPTEEALGLEDKD